MNNLRKITLLSVLGIILLAALLMMGRLFEEADAGEIVVIQHLNGSLDVRDQPTSFAWQGLGKATHYRRSNTFEFSLPKEEGGPNNALRINFNDGGSGWVSGSIRYDLPTDKQSMVRLHKTYGSSESLENHLIRSNVEKAVFACASLVSSRESYAEKKNDLLFYIEDQASRIKSIQYDKTVNDQIAAQQQSIMAVQLSITEAKRAEQRAITAEKEGQAKAAEAKWIQEVKKAETVTKAQADSVVASYEVKTAALKKQRDILEGEGIAAKKKLEMQANGALEQKLDAWVKVQGYYANALATYTGAIVPMYIGGGGNSGGNAFQQFQELMMMKTAKDLNLDLKNK